MKFGGELVDRSRFKACPKKSSGDLAPWAARTCWTARMVWTARMEVVGNRDVGQGAVCSRRFIGGYPVWRMRPAVNMCLPFAL